ncbi:uncharacterized protein PV07_00715 [Cladophialophora immunda]|uniref:Uncharacterized protein n=1 Tax=Cladophialophora immunda TaxID=569365 RepID=A0A0D2CVL7_9EURO|nr:uncharacterized protein PV07_00715 [Cladophialophora immunda]KIW33900.1 hypothetical protein PV07_00715 [Cladophialophora immunda]OQU94436.1 hypothetical protein CLAIMM_00794 isoform 2 [Cladophialophora immunda]
MPVFSAPYVGLPDPEKRTVESMEPPMTQITSPERRNKSWYKKLSLSSRSIGRSDRSSRTSTGLLESQARSEQEYLLLNKPLPPLPQPPYFEYMFADAGLKAMMSNESMRSTFEAHGNAQATIQRDTNHVQITIPSPSNGGFILDTPDIAQFAFAQAGVDVTTKDVIDSHFAALGTGLEGHLHIDMNEELEKERATESFFGGVEAREGPSPDHIPVVDEDGFADRREGLEDWPQLWAPDKETLADYEIPGSENFSAQLGKTPNHDDNDSDKPILQPKSQKNKVKAALQDPSLPDSFYAADGTITDPAVQPVQRPRPLTIRKRVKKRNARDSFVTRSTGNEPKPDDRNIHLLSTKKIRVAEKLVDQDANSSRVVSVCGSISDDRSSTFSYHDRNRNSSGTELTDVDDDNSDAALALKRKRLTTELTGYPGQFESYEADYLRVRVERRSTFGAPVPFTMGDPLHPNNEFTHTNFVPDPTYPSKNYTKADLDALPVRSLALSHAEGCAAHAASLSSVRSDAEETLRREVHRECAAARLEGVSVGQYRYYQGFMSLEDYIAARICVCWDFCWCSKLCTIYGDVLCPCSEWIGVHGD